MADGNFVEYKIISDFLNGLFSLNVCVVCNCVVEYYHIVFDMLRCFLCCVLCLVFCCVVLCCA